MAGGIPARGITPDAPPRPSVVTRRSYFSDECLMLPLHPPALRRVDSAGIKTAELRSIPARREWETLLHLRVQEGVVSCQLPVKAWPEDLRVGTPPPLWMIELAAE